VSLTTIKKWYRPTRKIPNSENKQNQPQKP